jgi:hypothetical protein
LTLADDVNILDPSTGKGGSMKTLTGILLFLSCLAFVGCDEKGDQATSGQESATPQPAPAKAEKPIELTAQLDLGAAVVANDPDDKRYEGIKVKAPAGSKFEGGAWVALDYKGKGYEIRFEFEDENFVQKAKKAAESDQADKLVKLHLDQKDAILWESASALGGEHNFLFAATVKVGDKTLVCRNAGYGMFSKAEAEALLRSCQSATR